MKFGVTLPQNTEDPGELLAAARLAEEGDLDSLWVVDNLQERPDPRVPFLESWIGLSAAAAVTSRITVGTLVQRVTLRQPRVAAAMAATLERIATGRLIMGLGVADASSRTEQEAFGIPYERKMARFERLRQTVGAMREVASGVPLWLGGESDATISHVGLFDGWNFWGPAERFPERAQKARQEAGGKPIEVSWAGPWRDFDLHLVEAGGAGHVIVATNTANYRKRIEMVRELKQADKEEKAR